MNQIQMVQNLVGNPQLWHLIKVRGPSPILTNSCHSHLSCTILLACLTSKPLFLKYSFTVSIHLFPGLPTEWLPAHSYIVDSLGNPITLHPLYMAETLDDSLICAFKILSILLILSNPLRLFICTALILDLSFSRFHNNVTAINKNRYKQCFMQSSSTLKLQILSIN